jgi:hypothetical protein
VGGQGYPCLTNNNFARDRIVNVDDVGDDEPKRLEIPLYQTGNCPHK